MPLLCHCHATRRPARPVRRNPRVYSFAMCYFGMVRRYRPRLSCKLPQTPALETVFSILAISLPLIRRFTPCSQAEPRGRRLAYCNRGLAGTRRARRAHTIAIMPGHACTLHVRLPACEVLATPVNPIFPGARQLTSALAFIGHHMTMAQRVLLTAVWRKDVEGNHRVFAWLEATGSDLGRGGAARPTSTTLHARPSTRPPRAQDVALICKPRRPSPASLLHTTTPCCPHDRRPPRAQPSALARNRLWHAAQPRTSVSRTSASRLPDLASSHRASQ